MADDKAKTAPQDTQRVNIVEDYEVNYWTEKFGCTRARLEPRLKRWACSDARTRHARGHLVDGNGDDVGDDQRNDGRDVRLDLAAGDQHQAA